MHATRRACESQQAQQRRHVDRPRSRGPGVRTADIEHRPAGIDGGSEDCRHAQLAPGLCRPGRDDVLECTPHHVGSRRNRPSAGRRTVRVSVEGLPRSSLPVGGVRGGTIESLGCAVLGQDVVRLERLQHERGVVSLPTGARIVTQVLASQYPLLRDDG